MNMSETTLTSQQKKAAKELLEQKVYQGDAIAAFRLFSGYVQGNDENFEKNPEKAMTYLQYSADLGFPHALDFMATLYSGTEIKGLKKEPNLEMHINYLQRLVISESIYDYNNVDADEREKFYQMQWDAYAKLGRLYITDDTLYERDSYLGYAISLKLAEERGCTESMYALGRYYRDRGSNVHYPSQTLMKKRDVWGMALYYYERAINNDNSKFASAAMSEYNHLAQYINERDGRSDETAIPYYQS